MCAPCTHARDVSVTTQLLSLRLLLVLALDLGLELDKLFGHFVRRSLGEYPQYGPASLVHLTAAAKREPTSTRALKQSKVENVADIRLD